MIIKIITAIKVINPIRKIDKKLGVLTGALVLLLLVVGTAVGLNGYFGGGTGSEVLSTTTSTQGLVGYWNFDEGTGQTTNDASDSNNDGTLGANSSPASDDPAWTSGKAGNGGALDFDGSNDHIRISDDASLDVSANAVSLFAWVKLGTLTPAADMTVVRKHDNGQANRDNYGFLVGGGADAADGELFFVHHSGAWEVDASGYILPDTNWHYIGVVVDGSDIRFYDNGVLRATNSLGSNLASNNASLGIGASNFVSGTENYFDGLIDDVRVYNRALSAAEVKMLYNRGGPVSHWKFDEGAGTTAFDSVGSNDGTLTGMADSDWVQGQYGTALEFDGTASQYVTVPDSASLDITDAITAELWVNDPPPDPSDPPLGTQHYYLAHWQWHTDAGGQSFWRCPGGDCVGVIDLRPLPAQGRAGGTPEGFGFFSYDHQPDIPNSLYLGDSLDSTLSSQEKAKVRQALNVKGFLEPDTIVDILWDILTVHADPTGQTGPKPLRGSMGKPVRLVMAGKVMKEEPFNDEHRARTIAVFQVDYERNKRDGATLKTLQKWTGATMRDLYGRMDNETAERILPRANRQDGWRKPETKIGDTFVEATDTNLESHTPTGPNAGTGWAIVEGTAGNLVVNAADDNVQRPVNTNESVWRMTDALSSDDHYVQASLSHSTNAAGYNTRHTSVIGRVSDSAVTYYVGGFWRASSSALDTFFTGKSVAGVNTLIDSFEDSLTTHFYVVKLEINGLALEVFADGTSKVTSTDTAITGNLYTGIAGNHTVANRNTWDNFEAGDLFGGTLVGKGGDAYQIRIDSDLNVRGYVTTASSVGRVDGVVTKAWRHVAMTYDGATQKLYIDGVLTDSAALSGSITTNNNALLIGESVPGKIDDVRVYNYARTAGEVRLDYNAGFAARFGGSPNQDVTRGLVGYWDFNDGTGTTANDSSDQNNDGTLTNGPAWTSGKAGNGGTLDFDGTDDFVSAANSSFEATDFTFMLWVNSDDVVSEPIANVAETPGSSTNDRDFYFDGSSQIVARIWDGSAKVARSTTIATTGTWYHVAMTADGTNLRLYVNGVNEATTSAGDPFTGYTTPELVIGRTTTAMSVDTLSDSFLNGRVDEVRFYNRVLTTAEVRYLYNKGGPIAHWKFDEGSGSTAFDASNITGDGTITGATYVTGQYGTALDFDGTDDEISVTNASPIDFDVGLQDAVTFSAWVNADTDGEGDVGRIVDKGANTYIRVGGESGGKLDLVASIDLATTDATLNVSAILNTNQWHHVMMTYEDDADDEISLYIDGRLVGTSTNGDGAPAGTDTNNLIIGGDSSTTGNFDGTIDDVRVYNYARTAAEIRLDYNAGFAARFGGSPNQDVTRGLVGYWNFEEGAGTTANDRSDEGNNGTLTNGPTWTTGKAGNGGALDFDGTDDIITVASDPSLEGFSAITLVAWIYPTANGQASLSRIISKSDGAGADDYALQHAGDEIQLRIFTSSQTNVITSGVNLALNTWHHAVGVYNGTDMRIYINGVERVTPTLKSGTIADSNGTLSIGSHADSPTNRRFKGRIDEALVYNRALSSAEVRYLYNKGGPVGHWKFDEGSGTTAFDASNITNDGTITGATYTTGQYGTALDFDGTDDEISITNANSIDFDVGLENAVTFSAWINADSDGEGDVGRIISKGTNKYLRVGSESAGKLDLEASIDLVTTGASTTVSAILSTNQWHHVAMTYENDADDEISLYVDGKLVGTSTNGDGAAGGTDTSSLIIGGDNSTTGNFDGTIDDVRVYQYARSASEVLADYNAGLSTHFQ